MATALSLLTRMGVRLLLTLSLLLCAFSPSIAQTSRYADSSDDGSRCPCPLVVGTVDDEPSARPAEEARCVGCFFGRFNRTGYSLRQIRGEDVAGIRAAVATQPMAAVDPPMNHQVPALERPPQA